MSDKTTFFEKIETGDGLLTIRFNESCQRIDANIFEEIQNAAVEVIDDESLEIKKFVFDLDNVAYVSSAGLRMFSAINKIAQQKNIEYKLINLRSDIAQMFNLTGYSSIFRIEEKSKY